MVEKRKGGLSALVARDYKLDIIKHDLPDEYAAPGDTARVIKDMQIAVGLNRDFVDSGYQVTPDNNPGLGYILSVAPGIARWLQSSKISSSLALDPFYMPVPGFISSVHTVDPKSTVWLANKPLCVALRARAKIEQQIYYNYIDQTDWLVVAAGRGRYPLTAAAKAKIAGHCGPHITFVDIDSIALHQIQGLAYDCVYPAVSLVDRDILDLKGFCRQRAEVRLLRRLATGKWPLDTPTTIRHGHYGVVSSIGMSMYIPDSVWDLTLPRKVLGRTTVKKAGVVEFYRSLWRHVKPGGIMMVDAINHGSPNNHVDLQLDTIQTIGWREMYQRSTEQVLDLAKRAGVDAVKIERHDSTGFFSIYVFYKKA
ncbi:MAG: hypothetical protein LBH36_03305 [Candidatus Nomurabacteria bacterium]|nr:hypothetical protein [Candidatus Nomurabacteria bacterium]